jgi:hypothetical protein
MGSIIDDVNESENARCSDVKLIIVYINLIGCPISFLFLLVGIIRMLINKKKSLSFLTWIILFIFSSEVMNIISKMLQLLKYIFEDTRDNYDVNNSVETPRGIICQIQIVISITSDFGALLGTLLLSIRCFDVIKSKRRLFDSKKLRFLSIIFIFLISIILSIVFLFIDRSLTAKSVGYKFDIRDRCSYWCWLDHTTSIICYICYLIILVLNILYAYKTNSFLKKGYSDLVERYAILTDNQNNNNNLQLNDDNPDKEGKREKSHEVKPTILKKDQKRFDQIKIMKMKCFIYPIITIIIWGLSFIYRIIDDLIFIRYDKYEYKEDKNNDEENELLTEHPVLKYFVQVLLVAHCILSSMRGIFYGFSFFIFEEKSFGNCFRALFYKCCFKKNEFNYLEEEEDSEEHQLMKIDNIERENDLSENDFRPSTGYDYERNNNDVNSGD